MISDTEANVKAGTPVMGSPDGKTVLHQPQQRPPADDGKLTIETVTVSDSPINYWHMIPVSRGFGEIGWAWHYKPPPGRV
jgi:hypothetical protein